MTEEKSIAAGAAGAGSGMLWAGGAAVGLAVGAAIWIFALGPLDKPAADAPVAAAKPQPAVAQEPVAKAAMEPASDEPVVADAAEPAREAVAEEPQQTADAAAAEAGPDGVAPAFDTVRAEADGAVLVAGRAAAGQDVVVMSDGAEVGRATADASGKFVAFLSMAPSAVARVLTLQGAAADGTMVASAESVILAPVAAPAAEVVASAAPVVPVAEPVADEAQATVAAPVTDEAAATEPAAEAASDPVAEPAAAPEAEAAAAAAEPEADAVSEPLIVDAEGVRKLAPAAVAGVVVDTITYGALGQVQIAGRGAAGSFARLYLDNTGIVTAPVGTKGEWSAVLTDVAPGVYTLRVDQLDASGSVTSRFETPFQREAPEVVTAAAEPARAAAETAAGTQPETEAGTVQDGATAALVPAAADAAPVAVTRAAIVTVQPGFTLWQIARENYGDGALYVKVFEANKGQIRDPDLIYPGQIFAVPEGGN